MKKFDIPTRYVVTGQHGHFVHPPEVEVEQNIEVRVKFALLLNEAIQKRYILGDSVEKHYQTLRGLGEMSESEAQEAYARLKTFVRELEATQGEPVSLHGETDQRYAGFAFKYLKPQDYGELGFEEPQEPGVFTRLEARQAVAYLYEQKKLRDAA